MFRKVFASQANQKEKAAEALKMMEDMNAVLKCAGMQPDLACNLMPCTAATFG